MRAPLLTVENLHLSFNINAQEQSVLNGISLSIAPGETVALAGESGSGKSLTAAAIMQLLPSSAHISKGTITWDGKNLLDLPLKDLNKLRGKDIGMIFQEPMTSLNPLHTIEKQLTETFFIHTPLSRAHARQQALLLLEKVKIRDHHKRLHAYPHELSGGERQRVMIAMAIAHRPKLLIADEPTTALDVTVQAQILDLLTELQKEMQMALLLISHDLKIVKKMAQRVYILRNGTLVESGPTTTVLEKPKQTYTKLLVNTHPRSSPLPFHKKSHEKPLLSVKNLSVSFPLEKGFFGMAKSYHHAIKTISLSLFPGETLGIVGESGSGKTTLALAILRLIESQGEIFFNNQSLRQLTQKQLRSLRGSIQIVFQDPFGSLNPRLSVFDIISEGLKIHKKQTPDGLFQHVDTVLTDVGLPQDLLGRYPHELSGGQRQRVCLARALVLKPTLLILDEPTSALDRSTQCQLIDLLGTIQQKYRLSYLFISHDLEVIKALSHRLIVLKNGEVIEEGASQDVFSHPKSLYTQTLLKAALTNTLVR